MVVKNNNLWLMQGDCLEWMKELDDNSVDSIVTDPPYGLSFMGKHWDKGVPSAEIWAEALRVLKPGGHLLAFAGTRTQHRMAVNIEDAGFEIRDMIAWVYGSGFPKSLDVSKAIDKIGGGRDVALLKSELRRVFEASGLTLTELNARCGFEASGYLRTSSTWASVLPTPEKWVVMRDAVGASEDFSDAFRAAEREVIGQAAWTNSANHFVPGENHSHRVQLDITAPATEAAKQWDGWGTALKPALEPITVARKPFKGTVAANVLENGTGAINIDGCRVGAGETVPGGGIYGDGTAERSEPSHTQGRWPANLIHDGSDEVVGLFPVTAKNSAARFFYCAKASKKDRDEGCEGLPQNEVYSEASVTPMRDQRQQTTRSNNHPTVKPTDLMRYLCRLVTPPNGIVLDPFMGSGSTGKAAMLEGFRFIGIELDPDYFEIAKQRIGSANEAKAIT